MQAVRWAFLAVALVGPAGCGTSELFGAYDLPESPDIAAAPWPRLADTPPPPAAGSYGPGYPDPAVGVAVTADLTAAAAQAARRAEALGQPVLSEAERRRLRR